MRTHWFPTSFAYDGSQLASLFAYQTEGLLGPSIVSWRGPCDITSHMVDAEDQRAGALIEGSDMIHFIIEVFEFKLLGAIALQRVLAGLVLAEITQSQSTGWIREGDDIYFVDESSVQRSPKEERKRKLSISIATLSPLSQLIHFAVNVKNEGTPVPTCALSEFSIDPERFARNVMSRFASEFTSIVEASQKVHPVSSFASPK